MIKFFFFLENLKEFCMTVLQILDFNPHKTKVSNCKYLKI